MSASHAIALARAARVKLTVDGDHLEWEAPVPPSVAILDLLRCHKAEVLQLLRAERRAVVLRMAQNFKSSPVGQCAHCGGGRRPDDPTVMIFCGTSDYTEVHSGCYRAWSAALEAAAMADPTFGFDRRDGTK